MNKQPNTQYVLSLSYGKDSIATLEAIHQLGYPLDRIVHAEIWATDTISADLPPMVEFKNHADKIIKKRYGIEVEHICAMRDGEKLTYEKCFYHKPVRRIERGGGDLRISTDQRICYSNYLPYKGFPLTRGSWCKKLKIFLPKRNLRISDTRNTILQQHAQEKNLDKHTGFSRTAAQGGITNTVNYLGIAADESDRIRRHTKPGIVLPLVHIGWDETYCRKWCEENDILSPIYHHTLRGGCWFCHNQSMNQLRFLRKNYPELWELLLKWDNDSPVTFHSDGHTVHDIDKRISYEEAGLIPTDRRFRWKMLDELDNQITLFDVV